MFGPDHPKLAFSLQCLSEILLAQGRYDEAEALARHGLAIRERIHGEAHQSVSISLGILAHSRQGVGDLIEAIQLYQRALSILESTVGDEHPRVVETQSNYAGALEQLQRHAEAAVQRARAEGIKSRLRLAVTCQTSGGFLS